MEVPKVKNVEKKIWDVENFEVRFMMNGKDVKGHKEGLPQYKYQNAAKNNMTVEEWRKKRFDSSYPGYQVDVLDVDGVAAPGQKKLSTVRDSYIDED